MTIPPGPVWGPQRAVYIAKNRPDLAVRSADNYEWYANVCHPSLEPVSCSSLSWGRRFARSLAPSRLITPCPLTGNTRISRKFTGRRNVRRHIAIRATNRKLYLDAAGEAGTYVEGFLRTTLSFLYGEGRHGRR